MSSILEHATIRAVITDRDVLHAHLGECRRDLTWFFSVSMHERSVTGAILERAALFSTNSKKCRFASINHGVQCCDGILEWHDRFIPRETGPRAMRAGDWCPNCSGSGYQPEKRRSRICPHCRGRRKERAQCHHCLGSGLWTVEAEGRESPTYNAEAVDQLISASAQQSARVSRRLRRAESIRAYAPSVLSAIYGTAGCIWEPRSDYAAVFAVWPLTRAGQALDGIAQHGGDVGGSILERLHAQVLLERHQKQERRGVLMASAEQDATEMAVMSLRAYADAAEDF